MNLLVVTIDFYCYEQWVREGLSTQMHSPMTVSALVSDKPETSKYHFIQCDTNIKGEMNSLVLI